MGRDSAFPEGFLPSLENLIGLGRDELIDMQNDLAHRVHNLSRLYPAGSARSEGYKAEIRMIENALKELDKIEGVSFRPEFLSNSREDIAEQLYTSRIDAVKYRSDIGGPDPETTRFYLERNQEAERLAKELADMGYPLTAQEMKNAEARIKDRRIRVGGLHARRKDIMDICSYCKASILSKSIYCPFCGHIVGIHPTHFVFVSYGSDDKEYVESVIIELKKRNIDAWFDSCELKIGMSIQGEISKALADCKVFLFFASCKTLKKEWPKEELAAAIVKRMKYPDRVRIIPLLLDDCTNDIPPLLTDTKYSKFFNEDGKVKLDSQRGKELLSELVDAIVSFRPKNQ